MESILAYYEDANIVALGISGEHEEAQFLRIVCICMPPEPLAIAEDYFEGAAVFGWFRI